jgi:hypothetical protein
VYLENCTKPKPTPKPKPNYNNVNKALTEYGVHQ